MATNKHPFTAEPRTVTGRKVKTIRAQGTSPANIFGSKVKSISIQVNTKNFLKLYETVGDTGLIDLTVKGEKESRPCLVNQVQTHPVDGKLLHVDFRQVDLKSKITANVPVELIGESPAVHQGAILVQSLDEVEVEALPTDFPDKLELDISKLTEAGNSLHVKDLKIDSAKLSITNEPDAVVVHVEAPKEEEEPTPSEATPEVEITEEKGEAKEGDQPAEDKKDESSDKPSDDQKE